MVYAVSDIHGCYDKYIDLLNKINFSPDDTLYVLGDVIDRGPDGFKIMLDMAQRPNVVNLLGNHEAMAMDALSRVLSVIQPDGGVELSRTSKAAALQWDGSFTPPGSCIQSSSSSFEAGIWRTAAILNSVSSDTPLVVPVPSTCARKLTLLLIFSAKTSCV